MNIAVTGATGFIGRHVLAELDRRGLEATLIARPSSNVPAEMAGHRVARLDATTPATEAYAIAGKPDTLIHLAWGGLPNYKSLHHFESELPAQYALLKGFVQSGLRTLVVTGTCFEYGMQSGSLKEDFETRPANPYGLAKDSLRKQLEHLRAEIPFNLTWARLFYMHGDGQAENSLLPQLKRAAERGDKTFPMSGGEQLRDYSSVDGVAKCLVDLALMQHDNGVLNVCSGKPISVRRLVENWIAENGWVIQPELGRFAYSEHEPMAFWGDDTKLRSCLNRAAELASSRATT